MISNDVFRQIKRKAAEEGSTLQKVANDLLRRGLTAPRGGKYKLRLQGWKATLQPGVDLLDRDKLFDLMEGR